MLLIDGEPDGHIQADSRAFAYGDGLFETIAVSGGNPLALELHLERLFRDALTLRIATPPAAVLRDEVAQLCARRTRGVLKITLTRGAGGRGYRAAPTAPTQRVLSMHPWPNDLDLAPLDGLAAFMCKHPVSANSVTAGCKHLNRLDQVLASLEWPSDDYFEGLMCDERGFVVEGTRSNVFAVTQGQLLTPDLSSCGVRGVVRDAVIDHCLAHNISVSMRDISLSELARADEIFITNSIIGVRGLGHIAPNIALPSHGRNCFTYAIRDALRRAELIE